MKKVSIELYRFVFMLIIVFWHFRNTLFFANGYLAVEFFFILSGYLLYKSFLKSNYLSPLQYTFRKIKRFFPEYFFALILSTIVEVISLIRNGIEIDFKYIGYRFITEVLFVQNIGFFYGGANYPCWYLCILIIGGLILWTLLKIADSRMTASRLAVLSSILYLSVYIKGGGTFERWDGFYPLIRGIAGLSLGIAIAKSTPYICMVLPNNSTLKNALELLFFIISIYAIITGKIPVIFMPIVFCFLVFFAFSNDWTDALSQRCCNLFLFMGDCTFGMLLYHAVICYLCVGMEHFLNIPMRVTDVVYVIALVLVSQASKKITNFVAKYIKSCK